jgi:hypothetical protein
VERDRDAGDPLGPLLLVDCGEWRSTALDYRCRLRSGSDPFADAAIASRITQQSADDATRHRRTRLSSS